jgi:hypothetical protein
MFEDGGLGFRHGADDWLWSLNRLFRLMPSLLLGGMGFRPSNRRWRLEFNGCQSQSPEGNFLRKN